MTFASLFVFALSGRDEVWAPTQKKNWKKMSERPAAYPGMMEDKPLCIFIVVAV
jgi:hypothetical protein